MKIVNEDIKHLTPRPEKEIIQNLDNEIKEWIESGLSGSEFLTQKVVDYLTSNKILDPKELLDTHQIYSIVADEIIITLFYNYLKKDEKKLAEAIKTAIENIKKNV